MAFELPTDRNSAPEFTTVAGFSIQRLSDPVLRVQYAETVRGWDSVGIQSKTDDHTLITAPWDAAVGRVLYAADGTLVGTVLTVAVDLQITITIDGPGLAGAAPVTLKAPRLNAFGIQRQEPATGARQWELAMSSGQAPHAARMGTLLGAITVNVVMTALAKLGITKTADEVSAAVQQMAADGNNLDSIIASTFEQLERDRRSGALTSSEFTPIGAVPSE